MLLVYVLEKKRDEQNHTRQFFFFFFQAQLTYYHFWVLKLDSLVPIPSHNFAARTTRTLILATVQN